LIWRSVYSRVAQSFHSTAWSGPYSLLGLDGHIQALGGSVCRMIVSRWREPYSLLGLDGHIQALSGRVRDVSIRLERVSLCPHLHCTVLRPEEVSVRLPPGREPYWLLGLDGHIQARATDCTGHIIQCEVHNQ
jgi:hypothetical protein